MFTAEDDLRLTVLVNLAGKKQWKEIALAMRRSVHQSRERWKYCLNPDINHCPWSPGWTGEEDALLMAKYTEIGPRWAQIGMMGILNQSPGIPAHDRVSTRPVSKLTRFRG
jgi:hypothetical protein